MSFCEVRIPTYKRPEWLHRALRSLLAQDFPHWKALVLDDSPDQEGRGVVDRLRDDRILYQPNRVRLGGVQNLDQAFVTKNILGGTWACVLEDDNWLKPSYLKENIRALDAHNVGLLMRNQVIALQDKETTRVTSRTTRGDWFQERRYEPLELHAYLFFFEGISNGGLFWHTSMGSNLFVGLSVTDLGLQEHCRTLQVNEPLYFKAEPLCVWSEMPIELSSRSPHGARSRNRGNQAIVQHLIRKHGKPVIDAAQSLSVRLARKREFETALADALYTGHHFKEFKKATILKRYAKSFARQVCIQNPLRNYLRSADHGQRSINPLLSSFSRSCHTQQSKSPEVY